MYIVPLSKYTATKIVLQCTTHCSIEIRLQLLLSTADRNNIRLDWIKRREFVDFWLQFDRKFGDFRRFQWRKSNIRIQLLFQSSCQMSDWPRDMTSSSLGQTWRHSPNGRSPLSQMIGEPEVDWRMRRRVLPAFVVFFRLEWNEGLSEQNGI